VFTINSIPTGQWTHLAGTYDGVNMKIYVNGVPVNTNNFPGSIFPGTDDLGIGGTVGGEPPGSVILPFAGLVDELSLYNRALSAEEIAALYSTGSTGKCVLPPQIVTQPQSQTNVPAGSNVTFTVNAAGLGVLGYQWRRAGTNLPGETNLSL